MIVYWKIGTYKTGKNITDEQGNEKEQTKPLFYPFFHFVFNIAQIEGVTFKVKVPIGKDDRLLRAPEEIIAHMPQCPTIQTGGNTAYYAPYFDYVQMPDKQHFVNGEAYYNCLFHELIHATGHPTRLGRFDNDFKPARFGDENYSREELVAEMGAVYLSSYTGISNDSLVSNSAAYLNGWMKALRDDNTLLITAANKAQKAAAFILGLMEMEEGQDGQEISLIQRETAAA
jgi:antirestriction protein ArdC